MKNKEKNKDKILVFHKATAKYIQKHWVIYIGKYKSKLFLFSVTRVKFHQKQSECPEAACPESWIGFQRKCFYFSDDTKNWTFSQRFCVSQGADLVQVETLQELVRK